MVVINLISQTCVLPRLRSYLIQAAWRSDFNLLQDIFCVHYDHLCLQQFCEFLVGMDGSDSESAQKVN
jgi:hypothetical protein